MGVTFSQHTETKQEMRAIALLSLTSLVFGAPQGYTGNEALLDTGTLDKMQEIFGKVSPGGYGASGDLATEDDETVDALVQVTKDSFPSDYTESNDNLVEDKTVIEIDTVFETCGEYTEEFGYECVPFYQCENGTIITDGAGLLDPRMVQIENGYASLAPELSKCPGATEVCCKDPDFTITPPGLQNPKLHPPYIPQCGRRNIKGLGANIHGFTESESQFGEWPH